MTVTVLAAVWDPVTYLTAVRGWDLGLWATFLSWGPDCSQRAGACSEMPGGVACDAAVKSAHVWVQS